MVLNTLQTMSIPTFSMVKVIRSFIIFLSGITITLALIDGTVKLPIKPSSKLSSTTPSPALSASNVSPFATTELVKIIPLDDNQDSIIIRRSGTMIFCLTRSTNGSNFFLSYDEGSTYHRIHGLQANSSQMAVISSLFYHQTIPGHIILTDIENKLLFISSRAGQEFQKVSIPFKPSLLAYHPDNANWIAGYDEDDGFMQIWISFDGGFNWHPALENVKQFDWGSTIFGDTNQTLFLITGSRNGGTSLSSLVIQANSNGSLNVSLPKTLLTSIEKFINHGRYIFAVRKAGKLGSTSQQIKRELWISIGRESFRRVILPITDHTYSDYQLVDITADSVIIGGIYNNLLSDLFISNAEGNEFKLSLNNVLYTSIKPDKRNPSVENQHTIYVRKVEALDGIYIANKGISLQEPDSVITFNYGATWVPISTPKDSNGKLITCNSPPDCSLHLTHPIHSSTSNYYPSTLSKDSSVGLIYSPGFIRSDKTTNLSAKYYYISRDAGLSFVKTSLLDRYFVDIIDSGSIIVAVKSYLLQEGTSEILYSLDYGATWNIFKFLPDGENISVHYLLPLSEGKSLSLILMCLNSTQLPKLMKHWVSVRINLSKILSKPCTNDDYQIWTPHEPDSKCFLGSEIRFQRKKPNAHCSSSGRDLSKYIQSIPCNCVPSDYQCDFGYTYNYTHSVCDQADSRSDAPAEETCQLGSAFLKTKGYMRVFGNRCTQGIKGLEPESLICPSNPGNSDGHTKKHGLNGIGTLLAFLIMTILCFIVVGLIVLCQGCPCDRPTQIIRSNYHVSPSDSNRYAINVTFDNKTLRSDYEYSDDEPLVQA